MDSAQCLVGLKKTSSLFCTACSRAWPGCLGWEAVSRTVRGNRLLEEGSCLKDLMKTSLCISHPRARPSTARYPQREGLQLARLGLNCPRQHPKTSLLLISRHLCLQLLETIPPLSSLNTSSSSSSKSACTGRCPRGPTAGAAGAERFPGSGAAATAFPNPFLIMNDQHLRI